MITLNKTKEIEIAGEVSLSIGYVEQIEMVPIYYVEAHGMRPIDDSSITYVLTSVDLVIGETKIDVFGQMDFPTIEKIKNIIDL